MTGFAICAYCGGDVAALVPVTDGFRVICEPARGGCAAESHPARSELGAVGAWNRDFPTPGAIALTAAALRRAGDLT